MQTDLVRGIDRAYLERTDPLVFALTGRTGSGCTTAAASLSKSFDQISLSEEDFDQPERRKMSIALEYAKANWVPFTTITVSSVIYSYLLDEPPEELETFLVDRQVTNEGRDELTEHLTRLAAHPSCYAFRKTMRQECTIEERAAAWDFFSSALSSRALQTRKVLDAQYAPLFQAFGDNIRFSGTALDDTIRPEWH